MNEATGLFAAIKMTETAKNRFYNEQATQLLHDYNYQQQARIFEEQRNQIYEQQDSQNPLSVSEYVQALAKINDAEQVDYSAADLLVLQYDANSETLFFMCFFNYDGQENVTQSVSAQALLNSIADYKDIATTDYIVFTDNAVNLLTAGCPLVWQITPKSTTAVQIQPDEISSHLDEMDKLSKKYYFDILDKYMQFDETDNVYYMDEDAFEKEFNPIDEALQKFLP